MPRLPTVLCQLAARRFCVRVRAFASKADPQITTELPKARLDYRHISENAVYKSHNAFNRKSLLPVGALQTIARLYGEQRQLGSQLGKKKHVRNAIGERVRTSSHDPQLKQAVLDEAKSLKAEIAEIEDKLSEVEDELYRLALAIPNDTHPESPIGPESAAAVLSVYGPDPLPASPSRDHVAICRALDLIDLEAAATVTGWSWYYLKNEGALLEIALINYALSLAMKHGFTPVTTPDAVRADIAYRCGFQPRDPDINPPVSQMYHITNSLVAPSAAGEVTQPRPGLVLAGTAEIPLAGMFANKILSPRELPIKVVGLGHAFRAEAGARGADTRGLYRVHQFTKLELFAVTEASESDDMMEVMKRLQTEICKNLGFPYRVLDMPTEELGASAYRKYDIEAWMPGRGSWGEISSTSNCTDYQARRLHIRHRKPVPAGNPAVAQSTDSPTPSDTAGLPFAHTLNGTAAAVPRLIVALVENGARFNESGTAIGIDLPRCLQPFWVVGSQRDIIRWV
ncbi:Serine--tRNA ligase, mitochondrial [Sparassis crispa]|uniref:serine--tRNA ligase n=1 Tax=Sparassis crispa TaxID=139825 RepID=A0A401G679_9APHY|nr:Serine--tRNA ligase, mitochondrial [Sparassis crispa]GBE77671.1 Serine--tRNA ligase, mitochondrial [Sparassis crispa]